MDLKGQPSLQLTFGLYIFAFISEKQQNIEMTSPWVIFLMQKKEKKKKALCSAIPTLIFYSFAKGINDCLYMFCEFSHS